MDTHKGTISTDEVCRPGYVAYSCAAYNLPDNTQGKVGLHQVYRPLDKGHEHMTDALRKLAREHYDIVAAAEKVAAEAKAARELAAIEAITSAPSKPRRAVEAGGLCRRCDSYCFLDCEL